MVGRVFWYFITMKKKSSNMLLFFLRFRGLFLQISLFLAALAAFPCGASEDALPPPRRALAVMDSLMAEGDLEPALDLARRFQAEFGEDLRHGGPAEARLGVLLLRMGKPEAALRPLENAIRKGPDRPEYHRNLGTALLALGRRGRALSEYQQAVEMAPRDFHLQLELGQLLLGFGDHARAAGPLMTARRLCGDCPEIQKPLAALFLAQRNSGDAIPILQQLWERDGEEETRRSLVQALQQAGRDSSLLAFLGGLEPAQLQADEALLLVSLEGRLGSWERSAAWARGSLAVPSPLDRSADFWGQVSYNLLQAEQDEPALAAADRALALAPDNTTYRNNRVVILLRLGREEEAHLEWEKVLELDPSLDNQK